MNWKPATDKQLYWINKLVDEKDIDEDLRATIKAEVADESLSSRGASTYLDILFSARKRPAAQLDVVVVERPRPSEEGFYLADGEVYKVVRTRDGERLYAKKTSPNGLVYVPGAMNRLFADQKLTPQQLAEQGLTQGYCVVCSHEFEDPTSKHIGIGPKCGKDQLGPEAYKALRLTVADRPDVVAFEAAKKARAKEAREAKKRQEAQLVLV